MSDWKVGQEVWVEPLRRYATSGAAKITKIGIKWAYLDGRYGRFNKVSGYADAGGYSNTYRVWASQEECENYRKREARWAALSRKISSNLPLHITNEQLDALETIVFGGIK